MHSRLESEKQGTLYVVATPIGNLEDITLRALKVLGSVDIVAAEDTRHTAKLLNHHHIRTRLFAYHEHNEQRSAAGLIQEMKKGADVALVSDAGTPSVSDPGYRIVAAAAKEGLSVIPIPGPSAAIAALSVSGVPTDSFIFIGFPPKKKGKRESLLQGLSREPRSLIFYESPNRIIRFVEEVMAVMGNRCGSLAREITKLHEEYLRGDLSDILECLREKPVVKGECTLIVGGTSEKAVLPPESLESNIRESLRDSGVRPSSLAKELSVKYGMKKNFVYEKIVEITKNNDE